MGRRQFFRHPFLFLIRPLPVNELEKIESDPDTVDPDQIGDVLDVFDVTIERAFFLLGTDQDLADPDHAAAFADHFDLLIANVAFDIVKFS